MSHHPRVSSDNFIVDGDYLTVRYDNAPVGIDIFNVRSIKITRSNDYVRVSINDLEALFNNVPTRIVHTIAKKNNDEATIVSFI